MLVPRPFHKSLRSSCCYYRLYETERYQLLLTSSGITFIPYFMKMVQQLKCRDTDAETRKGSMVISYELKVD